MSKKRERNTDEEFLDAIKNKNARAVKELLEQDLNIIMNQVEGNVNPITTATYFFDPDVFKLLVEDKRIDLNVRRNNDGSPLLSSLIYLCLYNDNNACSFIEYVLNDERTNPNIEDYNGVTPLMVIAKYEGKNLQKQLELLELFLNTKKVHFVNRKGLTVYEFASNPNVVQLFLNFEEEKKQEFINAIYSRNLEVVQNLLQRGLNPNFSFEDEDGWLSFPIILSAQMPYIDAFKKIIENPQTNVNVQGEEGLTALHVLIIGCIEGDEESCEAIEYILNDTRTDPNVKDINGKTPLMYLISSGAFHLKKHGGVIFAFFKSPKTNFIIQDNQGRNIFNYARTNETREAVTWIKDNLTRRNLG
jgi:ankyrin repeat protein